MNNATKHAPTCNMAFGRKDATCPRCQELLAGAKPVVWAASARKAAEARQITAIRSHVCGPKCGIVCTKFEW